MILYRVNNVWVGTQADAKTEAKKQGAEFQQVEVPTDKQGLMHFLNDFPNHIAFGEAGDGLAEDEFTAIVERQDPPVERDERVAQTVALDSAFQAAPLGQQLTLAAIAVENARSRIGKENAPKPAPQGYAGKVERVAPEPDPLDDLLG